MYVPSKGQKWPINTLHGLKDVGRPVKVCSILKIFRVDTHVFVNKHRVMKSIGEQLDGHSC